MITRALLIETIEKTKRHASVRNKDCARHKHNVEYSCRFAAHRHSIGYSGQRNLGGLSFCVTIILCLSDLCTSYRASVAAATHDSRTA